MGNNRDSSCSVFNALVVHACWWSDGGTLLGAKSSSSRDKLQHGV